VSTDVPRRFGSVIRLRPDKEEEYLRLHADVWPEVLRRIHDSGIRNYTIFLRDGWLFAYFEYVGTDFEADMARMAADPVTQDWWKLTDPCQERLETAAEGEQWSPMQEAFHVD
jgi:L-rhamnose mutarotase